jgi:trk system potassium uptake protein TrkA
MNIIITGNGHEVYFLSKNFMSSGHKVTIITSNMSEGKILARFEGITVVYGDSTLREVLEDAGILRCDLLIAMNDMDKTNLVTCLIGKEHYDVERTLAIVNNPKNIQIFKKIGISTVLSVTQIISSLIEQKTLVDDVISLAPIEEGKVSIMEIAVNGEDNITNKTLMDFNLPYNALIGCVIRGDRAIIPKGNTVIRENDKLVILCLPSEQSEVMKSIKRV